MTDSPQLVSVVIADSQFLINQSLELFVGKQSGFRFAGTATTFNHLMSLSEHTVIDVLITDFNTFDFPSMDAVQDLKNIHPNMRILLLTSNLLRHDVGEFGALEIKNIIYKTTDEYELLRAMEATAMNRKFYGEEVLELLMESASKKVSHQESSHLTAAEIDIVKWIAQGMTNKEIANRKNISFHTVVTHRKNIFRKLNVSSGSELILYAIKAGWVDNIEYYI